MFFPERIQSIKLGDKVLEIGPGATPHFRSDIFLEMEYETEKELIEQSGHVGVLHTDKRQVTYKGGRFPFVDNEFDYVICSHVLEHVDDADTFLQEIQRVAKKGYLEFPTIYYDYMYNIPEHKLFLFYKDNVISWMTKKESGLQTYASVQNFFHETLDLGYHDLIQDCKNYFFHGFEWSDKIESKKVENIDFLTYSINEIKLLKKSKMLHCNDYSNISLKEHLKFKIRKFLK